MVYPYAFVFGIIKTAQMYAQVVSHSPLCPRRTDVHSLNEAEPNKAAQKPPYLIECDDSIGLIRRFPLDVDLLLKGPPLDGLKRNSSWNYRREML